MKKLIVVDLDNTLIPFDSFRNYVISWMRYLPISISFISLRRKLRLINQYDFKKKILKKVQTHRKFSKVNNDIANLVIKNYDKEVIDILNDKRTSDSEFLLLSASPDFYVRLVGNHLGWGAKGSHFTSKGQFIHMYGDQKKHYIDSEFPPDKFNYYYAIADSDSDDSLLNMFETSDKI